MSIMMAEDESIIFDNILVLTEVSVKSHMKVDPILMRETGGGVILQQSSSLAATGHNNASQNSS